MVKQIDGEWYYSDGDICPNCEKGRLATDSPHEADGIGCLVCEDCRYDASEDEPDIEKSEVR